MRRAFSVENPGLENPLEVEISENTDREDQNPITKIEILNTIHSVKNKIRDQNTFIFSRLSSNDFEYDSQCEGQNLCEKGEIHRHPLWIGLLVKF